MIDYREHITIEPGKRGGKSCVRRTVVSCIRHVAGRGLLADFPALTREGVLACLAYAADCEQQTLIVSS